MWIDSICINQQDIAEKTRQVRLMHHIYRQAFKVTVWLGHFDDSHLAVSLLSILVFWHYTGLTPEEIYIKNIDDMRSPRWLAAIKLLIHPWFDRV
jgi:hypothetical protein